MLIKQFVIVEYLQESKLTTSTDKSLTCNPCILTQKLLPISVLVSTSNEKVLKPYWTESCKEISSLLWLPTKTVLQDLDSNSSNTSLPKTVDKSWFSTTITQANKTNSQLIFSQYYTSSHAECTDLESTIIKSKKIYLNPTKQQKKILTIWGGTSRFVYNRTIDYINSCDKSTKLPRWDLIFKEINLVLPEWTKDVPYQIKKIACKDAVSVLFMAIRNLKKGNIKHFKLQYRTKKDIKTTIYIPKDAVKLNGIYYTILGKTKYNEKLPTINYDCRLVEMYGDYYLCVPEKTTKAIRVDNQDQSIKAVAIDLGVRSFVNFYTEESVGKIGIGAGNKIYDILLRANDVIKDIAGCKTFKQRHRKRKLKTILNRLKAKVRHLIDELHKKTAKYLTDNFNLIILPKFNVINMIDVDNRKIGKKTVRSMLSYRFYDFRMYMRTKCKELGIELVEIGEEYTTKTISWTGEIREGVGGSKWISSGDIVMDRDYNGARGIYIKAIKELSLK